MDPELQLVHQHVRLRIMASLAKHRDVGFKELRDALELTDGNLQSHCQKLEDAGLIASRRALGATGVMVRYEVTPRGDAVLQRYAQWVQETLAPTRTRG